MKPDEFIEAKLPEGKLDTEALWENFLENVRSRNRATLSTPGAGAAAFTTVALGVKSYREGKVLFWDKDQRKPHEADAERTGRPSWRGRRRQGPGQAAPDPRLARGREGQRGGGAGVPETGRPLARR